LYVLGAGGANRSQWRLIIGQHGLRRRGGADNEQQPQTSHDKPRLKAPVKIIAFSISRIAKYCIRQVNEVASNEVATVDRAVLRLSGRYTDAARPAGAKP
jgi:hypothetical protein